MHNVYDLLSVIANGENCTQSGSCLDMNAECHGGFCTCDHGYHLYNGTCEKGKNRS